MYNTVLVFIMYLLCILYCLTLTFSAISAADLLAGFSLHPHFQRSLRLICSQDFEDNQDELPNNFHSDEPEDSDFDDGSEPWYGNDVDRAEYYGVDDGPPSPGPPSPALTQCFYDEDDSSTESELAAEIKRVFSPMYYERKRKREEMENGEDDDDA